MRLLAVQFVVLALAALTASPAAATNAGTPPSGAVVVYTKDNAPATPKLDVLPLKESVSEYGITWTFEKPTRVAQFINGDWYVVDPCCRINRIPGKPLAGCVLSCSCNSDFRLD